MDLYLDNCNWCRHDYRMYCIVLANDFFCVCIQVFRGTCVCVCMCANWYCTPKQMMKRRKKKRDTKNITQMTTRKHIYLCIVIRIVVRRKHIAELFAAQFPRWCLILEKSKTSPRSKNLGYKVWTTTQYGLIWCLICIEWWIWTDEWMNEFEWMNTRDLTEINFHTRATVGNLWFYLLILS